MTSTQAMGVSMAASPKSNNCEMLAHISQGLHSRSNRESHQRLMAASLYLHFFQPRQQRLVGLTHLLLASPRIFQGLLDLLLFSLRNADRF